MDDNTVYVLSDELNSIIGKDIVIMDQWLTQLSDEELSAFHTICNKDSNIRSSKQDYEITKYSLVLYCRELELNELAITSDLINDITGIFCINIIVESMRRKGLVETSGPLMIYKETKFSLTDKGKELGKGLSEEKEGE